MTKAKIKNLIFLILMPVACFLLVGIFSFSNVLENAFALSGNGGIFLVSKNSTFNMTNGSLSGGSATNGGAVYVASGGTFTMSGGTISGNSAADNGGGIYNAGTATLSGVTVSGNSGNLGSNIYNSGTMMFQSGQVGFGSLDKVNNSVTRVDANGNASANGEYVLFGSWPQTVKASDVTIDTTNVDENGFFLGSDGARYAKSYTYPSCSTFSDGTEILYTDGNAFYYFKVEPLMWKILKEENGQALIFCEKVVDFMMYSFSYVYEEQSNYKLSGVREFLNGEFYTKAFSDQAKKLIALSEIDNSAASTGASKNNYVCENTIDYVFSLSVQELNNIEYFPTEEDRARASTDWTVARGAFVGDPTDPSDYVTRSPSYKAPALINVVQADGTYYEAMVNIDTPSREDWLGVVPALNLNISNSEIADLSDSDSGIYNDGAFYAYGGVLYGKVVSLGEVHVKANNQYYLIPFDLKDTGTMVIEDYSGSVVSFSIQVSKHRSTGVIATFSNNTAVPVLSHFRIEGIDAVSHSIKIEQNDSGEYVIKLYAANEYLDKSFINEISGYSNLKKLQFLGAVPSDYKVTTTLTGEVKICVNQSDPTDVAVVYEYGTMVAPEDCSSLFSIPSLESISLRNLSFVETTNISMLFANCSKLISVSGFDNFSQVQSASGMFYGCSSLQNVSLNAERFYPTNIARMFYGCSNLVSISGGIGCYNIVNMSSAFYNCSSLTGINFYGRNTGTQLNLANAFYNCSSLIMLSLNNLNIPSGTNMTNFLQGCTNLISLDLSSFDMSKVTAFDNMLNFGESNKIAILKTPFGNTSAIPIVTGATLTFNNETVSEVPANIMQSRTYISSSAIEFPSDWKEQINSLIYMTTKINISEISEIAFTYGSAPGGVMCGVLSSGIEVYKNNSFLYFYYPYKTIIAPTSCQNLFGSLDKVEEIVFNNFNTNKTTNMSGMFQDSINLKTLNLRSFDTSNVTNMRNMFSGCKKIENIWSSFDTSKVTDMSCMFYDCVNVGYLDLSSFNTSKVTLMNAMFYNCNRLYGVNLSSFNTQTVTTMENMFLYCYKLTSLDLSSFNTVKVTNMQSMFSYCSSLRSLDLSNFDLREVTKCSNVININSMSGLEILKTPYNNNSVFTFGTSTFSKMYNLDTGDYVNSIPSNTTESITFVREKPYFFPEAWKTEIASSTYMTTTVDPSTITSIQFLGSAPTGYSKIGTLSTGIPVYAGSSLVDIVFVDSFIFAPEDSGGLFCDLVNLESINLKSFLTTETIYMNNMFGNTGVTELDLSMFDTSKVTDMVDMFCDCSELVSVNLSSFNTSNVTYMGYMFSGCSSLTSLDLSSFNTASVEDMEAMFERCSSLTNLDLSNFNTAKVTSMWNMFGDCSALTNLNISSFNTSNLSSMIMMFYNCSSLTSLDLSSFDTSTVTGMSSMFNGCSGLTSLDLSNFDTSNVSDMSYMFYGCSKLTSLDLSNFNTSNVTSMSYMFYGCSGLTNLDLSNFNTTKVTNMSYMFSGCTGLTTLDVSSFNMSKVTSSSNLKNMLNFGSSNKIDTLKTPYNNAYAIAITTGSSLYYNGSLVSSVPANTTTSLTYVVSVGNHVISTKVCKACDYQSSSSTHDINEEFDNVDIFFEKDKQKKMFFVLKVDG